MLALDHPHLVRWFAPLAAFSMFPLLVRDGQALTYIATQLFFLMIASPPSLLKNDVGRWFKLGFPLSCFGVVLIHLGAVFLEPPVKYPYLRAAAMTTYAFVHFGVLFLHAISMLLRNRTRPVRTLEKKHI
jgi:hypothetical protein